LDFANDLKSREKKTRCNIDEAHVIQKMLKKHGVDWEKMKKDLKLNKFMWTEKFIENKSESFKKYWPDGV